MPEPVPGRPAWHPDPTGRHEYRWWDGTTFTRQVADEGAATVEADLAPPAPAPPAPVAASPFPATQPFPATPWFPPAQPDEPSAADAPAAPAAAAPPANRRRVPLLVAGVLAVAVAAGAAWYLFLRDDGSGTGTFEDRAGPGRLGIHRVQLAAGTALSVEVEPGGGLDAVLAVVVPSEVASDLEDLYADLGLVEAQDVGSAFPAVDPGELERVEDGRTVLRTDVGFAGEDEELLLVVPFDVDLEVVVGPFGDGDDDTYRIRIDAFGVDADEDATGEELLDAVLDADGVPNRVRGLAEELLELGE